MRSNLPDSSTYQNASVYNNSMKFTGRIEEIGPRQMGALQKVRKNGTYILL
jgi:hypothetical protein